MILILMVTYTGTFTHYYKGKIATIPVHACIRPSGSQEFEVPRFRNGRHMKMVIQTVN